MMSNAPGKRGSGDAGSLDEARCWRPRSRRHAQGRAGTQGKSTPPSRRCRRRRDPQVWRSGSKLAPSPDLPRRRSSKVARRAEIPLARPSSQTDCDRDDRSAFSNDGVGPKGWGPSMMPAPRDAGGGEMRSCWGQAIGTLGAWAKIAGGRMAGARRPLYGRAARRPDSDHLPLLFRRQRGG